VQQLDAHHEEAIGVFSSWEIVAMKFVLARSSSFRESHFSTDHCRYAADSFRPWVSVLMAIFSLEKYSLALIAILTRRSRGSFSSPLNLIKLRRRSLSTRHREHTPDDLGEV